MDFNIDNIHICFEHLSVYDKRKKKNWSKGFYSDPVEAAIMKEWHGNPTLNFTINNNHRYLSEPNQQDV